MTAVIPLQPAIAPPVHVAGLTRDQVELLKRTIADKATDDELALFVQVCNRTGLDPFAKQIYAVKRWDNENRSYKTAYQVGIDGFRLIAQRSGEYEGQVGPYYLDAAGVWHEYVWTGMGNPVAARVGVHRKGFRAVLWGVARWSAYAQKKKDGGLTKFWTEMGPEQLAKCAEALGLRKAFPLELSGLYTNEEMDQAEHPLDEEPSRMQEGEQDRPTEDDTPMTLEEAALTLWGRERVPLGDLRNSALERAHGWAVEKITAEGEKPTLVQLRDASAMVLAARKKGTLVEPPRTNKAKGTFTPPDPTPPQDETEFPDALKDTEDDGLPF